MYLSHSKSPLFHFSHTARFRKTVELINPQPGQTILDYGCADGRLLQMLPNSVNKIGYDPNPSDTNGLMITKDISSLEAHSCDTITLCEVLEHVSKSEVEKILNDCRRLLKPKGKLIVSVPIEVGLSALVKNVARWIKVRPLERQLTIKNVVRAAMYLPAKREPEYLDVYGHTGFDYRKLRLDGFALERTMYSPLPFGAILNSQVFYVLVSS